MAKDNAGVAQKQVAENPIVRIEYNPENALIVLGSSAASALKAVRKTTITNPTQLASATEILNDAEICAEQIEVFKATLRERVQQAIERFRSIPNFEDIGVTLTFRTWSLNQSLMDGIRNLKNLRANYLAEEDRKVRQRQADAEAEQRRKNQENADRAAKAAKAQGADKETIAQIKSDVMATPAPIVESKARRSRRSRRIAPVQLSRRRSRT